VTLRQNNIVKAWGAAVPYCAHTSHHWAYRKILPVAIDKAYKSLILQQ